MTTPFDPTQQREFRCDQCKGLIRIPANLPPTTAPCPHCGSSITSPDPDSPDVADAMAPAQKVESPFPVKGPKILSGREDDHLQEEVQETKRSYMAAIIALAAVALAVAVGGTLAMRELKKTPAKPKDTVIAESESVREAHYIRIGWKKDAYEVLDNFLKGTTPQEKIPYVLHGESLREKMEAFYGEGPINDSDTPAEAFSTFDLSEEDKRRGLFMLIFDQPPQFVMRDFFRPLASLEVQYGLEEVDMLLTSMARISNFASNPLRAHAFFRKTPDGLKLDWEIFVQTKYRMLERFLEVPRIGKKRIFRVFIAEDMQDQRFSIVTSRTYRIADPANTDHATRVLVPVDSDIGRELSAINWVGVEDSQPQTRTATIELEWQGSENQPYLAIKRFFCWEFMGLGGDGESPVQQDLDNP